LEEIEEDGNIFGLNFDVQSLAESIAGGINRFCIGKKFISEQSIYAHNIGSCIFSGATLIGTLIFFGEYYTLYLNIFLPVLTDFLLSLAL